MARVPNWPGRRIPSAAVNLIRPAVLAQELLANGFRLGPGGVADRAAMCPKVSVGGGPGHAVRAHADRGVRPMLAGPQSPVPGALPRSPAGMDPSGGSAFDVRTASWGRTEASDIAGNGSGLTGLALTVPTGPAEPAGAGSGHLPTSCRYFFGGGKRSERTDHEGCRGGPAQRGLEDAVRAERPGIPGPWRMAATRGGGTR
jgi:hypothetical protein